MTKQRAAMTVSDLIYMLSTMPGDAHVRLVDWSEDVRPPTGLYRDEVVAASPETVLLGPHDP